MIEREIHNERENVRKRQKPRVQQYQAKISDVRKTPGKARMFGLSRAPLKCTNHRTSYALNIPLSLPHI